MEDTPILAFGRVKAVTLMERERDMCTHTHTHTHTHREREREKEIGYGFSRGVQYVRVYVCERLSRWTLVSIASGKLSWR